MHVHEEIELKWAVDAAGHAALGRHLAQALGSPRILAQENRFFDTKDRRLRHARMNLRFRHENGRLLLTCKRKTQDTAAGLAHHQEWEEWIDPALWEAPPERWQATLPLPDAVRAAIAGQPLEALGGFRNHRREFRHRRGPVDELLCLDETAFAHHTDHELEIETADPGGTLAHWRAALATWGIPWRPQPLTKFARYLRT